MQKGKTVIIAKKLKFPVVCSANSVSGDMYLEGAAQGGRAFVQGDYGWNMGQPPLLH